MALAHAVPTIPSSSPACVCRNSNHSDFRGEDHKGLWVLGLAKVGISRVSSSILLGKGRVVTGRWKLSATDTRIVENAQARTNTIEIPVTCYQLIGVPDQAEKDEIVKSVMDLRRAEIEEGFTMDAVLSRQDLLMDLRDKLLFEPEYAGNLRQKIPPKSPLRIPWTWLPGALCLLQEVGEEKLVLDIGRAALQHPEAKPYVHDLLLSMALAECAIAKIGFEKNKVSQGFEALARAQCLLRSKISLGKMMLLSQIEESLEELAPACTLELLGMPHSPENAERRRGAIAALHEMLRQGLDVETTRQVQDWPCFLSQALNRLMATEIVDLLPWTNLANIRKNKKSIESQNQRVVIDFNCFYVALIAHIALGFSSKQADLINKAKSICDCLITSEGIDLKFESAFCLFLLGQGSENEAVEKLRELELNSDLTARNALTGKEVREYSEVNPSLAYSTIEVPEFIPSSNFINKKEMWLKDCVLTLFPDTRDCSPSLVNFFRGERKALGSKKIKGATQTVPNVTQRPISTHLVSERRDFEDSLPYSNSSRHPGLAAKQLAPSGSQSPLILGKNSNGSNDSEPSVQLKRNLGAHHKSIWEIWLAQRNMVERITIVVVLGCFVFFTFKLSCIKLSRMKNSSNWGSVVSTQDSSLVYNAYPSCIKESGVACRLKKLFTMVKMHLRNHRDASSQGSSLPASLSTSVTAVYRRPMPLEEAEALVVQWQAIKAEALGPSHQIDSLSEALDESMLVQWQALADAAKARSCYWRFVLLQLTVLRADILSDGIVGETAEIEAILEEAAELVDETQLKNPNYYSTYRVRYVLKRQEDGSWRFCEGDIQTPS